MSNLMGKTLMNRYDILEVIGQGGMAVVYKGFDKFLNRVVAVKVLKREFIDDDIFMDQFENEARASASLSHPNIINIYDVGKDGIDNFIVMEYINGRTLKDYIRSMDGYIKEDSIINIGIQIASAIGIAHENGIIHRDIKAQNVMIDEKGNVKIADFGIAKAVSKTTMVNTKEMIGSVHYASPEQARGGIVDSRSDLYSTGILFYELITKTLPFNGDSQVQIALKQMRENVPPANIIATDISEGLNSIVGKLTEKDPNDRYNNADELKNDLNKIQNDKNFVVMTGSNEDDLTRMLPKIDKGEDMKTHTKATNQPTPNRKKKKKKNGKVSSTSVFLVVLAALVLALAIFIYVFFSQMKDLFTKETITVPSVENVQVDEAVKILSDLGLIVDSTERRFSNSVEEEHVISQSMNEGREIKEGFTIRLVVSNGPNLVSVPNVLNKDITEARILIENNNLVIDEILYEYSDYPAGKVIDQSLSDGTKVAEGTLVDLTVSQGNEEKSVIVPNLVGKTPEEAQLMLEKMGLKIGSIEYELSDDYVVGDIIQHQYKTETVDIGSEIDVVVSNGKLTVDETSPDAEEEPLDEELPEEEPEEVKLITRTIQINREIFKANSHVIKVELVSDDETIVAHEGEYDKPTDNVKIKLEAPDGSYIVKIYFDSELVSSMPLTFN